MASSGVLVVKFEKKSYLFYFSSIFSLSLSYFFQLNTLKGTAEAPAMNFLKVNTPRRVKTAFLTTKKYDNNNNNNNNNNLLIYIALFNIQ